MTVQHPHDSGIDEAAFAAMRGLARAARMLERATDELSMPQYRVLASVAAGEDRASRVAERLELGRPAVSSVVEALCVRGLLEQRESNSDQRAFDLRATPAGLALLDRVEREMTRALRELCARVYEGDNVLGALAALDGAVESLYAERRAARRGESR